MKRSLRTKILLLVTGTIAVLAALVAAATTVLARRELDRQVRAAGRRQAWC